MSEQVQPIVKVCARYVPGRKYPYRIRMAMSDGTTQWYEKEEKQQGSVFRDMLDRYTKLCIGERKKENE